MLRLSIVLAMLAVSAQLHAADFYVATDGSDANPGTLDAPFATVQRAQRAASPGDTVWIRGGTYVMQESQVARTRGIFAYVTDLDKSGEPGKPIKYWAYKDERPIFDLSKVMPADKRVDAFYLSGSWLHIKGLEVVGVQVTIKTHTQSICFENDGSNNLFELLSMHDNQAIGIYSRRGSDNLFLNCDAYNNYDYTSENGRGGNVDGFGCHPPKGGTGNVFRGCRAWFNSDDGYDCINAHESVTFENCWAMYNGFTKDMQRKADGNGFKAGGYGATPVDRLPNPIPRHVVRFCVAVGNKANGFYANHHTGGVDFLNNTAYRNAANFNMLCREADNKTDIDGFGHVLRNNLGYKGAREIVRYDPARCDAKNNSFDTDLKLTDEDFQSLDEAELLAPRQPNGDLPAVKFMRPVEGRPLAESGQGDKVTR